MIREILNRLQAKDRDSERILFEMFYQRIYNIAFFITTDRDLAQDVVQETFLKAFRRIHTLKDGNKIEAWLASIATRTALDFLRKEKRWNDIPTEDVYLDELVSQNQSVPSLEQIVEQRFLRSLLQQEISELKPEHKQVMIFKYGYDLKDEEIANVLEININTVKSRINRAKQSLRISLEKKLNSEDGDSHEKYRETQSR